MGAKSDIKKPELATADGQKNMGAVKIREGAAKKSGKQKKRKGQGKKREFTRAREGAALCFVSPLYKVLEKAASCNDLYQVLPPKRMYHATAHFGPARVKIIIIKRQKRKIELDIGTNGAKEWRQWQSNDNAP